MNAIDTMKSPSILRACVAVSVGLALVTPASASASVPSPAAAVVAAAMVDGAEGPQATLKVDVELGEDDDIVGQRLSTEATTALAEADVTLVEGTAPSTIAVSVRYNSDDDHEITLEVTNKGEPTQTVDGSPFICEACSENELLAKIREVAPQAAPLLPADDDKPGPEQGTSSEANGGGNDPITDDGSYRKIGPLGYVGIVGLAGGLGLTIFGAVDLSKGRETTGGSDAETNEINDHRPRGLAFVSAGAGVVVLSAVALAIDLTVLKKKRARRAARVSPMLSPSVAGLSVSGRF